MLNKLAIQFTDLTPIVFKPEKKISITKIKKQHLNNDILNKPNMDYDKHEKAYIKGQELIGKLMSANKTFFKK